MEKLNYQEVTWDLVWKNDLVKTIEFYLFRIISRTFPRTSFLLCGLIFFPVSLSTVNIIGLIILLSSFVIHSYIKVINMKKDSHPTQPADELEIVKTDVIPDSYKSVLVFIKEDNETEFETAKREAFEEAGVDIHNLQYVGYYRLASGHTTLIVTAEVEKFHEIPEEFETVERKFMSEFPLSLSFYDAVYPWLVKNLC
jgi:hypothetical protein